MRTSFLIIGLLILNQVIGYSCTIFSITKDGRTLFGNNEDYIKPNTKVWFTQEDSKNLGCIFFSFDDFWPQGGMNSEGLVYDWASTPVKGFRFSTEKIQTNGSACITMLQKCKNVNDAISFINKYNLHELKQAHMLIADRYGNSAVVEWNENDVSIIKGELDHQVLTNFNLHNVKESSLQSGRYYKANQQLDKCDTLTIDLMRDILNSVHQYGKYPTLYSNVYDLNTQKVYVYYRHNYDYVHVFDLKEELKSSSIKRSDLAVFFPEVIITEFKGLDYKKRYNNEKLNILANELLKIKEYKKAILTYEYNLKLYPDSKESLNGLIGIYALLNDERKIKKYTKQLEKLK